MKIAILTQPLHYNYGGNLQNYALQKVLKDMGHDPITIDRHPSPNIITKLKLGYFKRLAFSIIGGEVPEIKSYFLKNHHEWVYDEINRFIVAHIKKSPRLYSDKQVHEEFKKNQFDAVVVGSDQCWRPIYSPNIYTYFLDFLQNNETIKKLSYAASLGTDDWEFTLEQTEKCKKLIKEFDYLTVREKSAVNLVKEKFNVDAKFVLDPTLLLSKDDYEQLINGTKQSRNNGLYTYILDESNWKNEVVKTVKNKLNLRQYSCQQEKKNLGRLKIPSIENWINGFIDATFVITDSYHGTLFSIIFGKPFISLTNINRGASRFESILNELDLNSRLLREYDEKQIEVILSNYISYDVINEKIQKLREYSLRELKININEQHD